MRGRAKGKNQKSLLCHLIGISGLLKEMFSESEVEQGWSPTSLIWNLTFSPISSTPSLGYHLRGLLIDLISQLSHSLGDHIPTASGIFFWGTEDQTQGPVHSRQALCHCPLSLIPNGIFGKSVANLIVTLRMASETSELLLAPVF